MPGLRVVMIIAPEGFRDEELFHTKEELESAGINVSVASRGTRLAKGKLGAEANVDIEIRQIIPDNFNAIIFVGGPGAAQFFDDPELHKLARDFFDKGKITAAICIAPTILANAGLLKDKKATAYPSEEDRLKSKGAEFTSQPVTKDGIIITANGPSAAREFGKAIAKAVRC